MSCGKPHEVPCTEVLALVYSYIDGEMDDGGCVEIAGNPRSDGLPVMSFSGYTTIGDAGNSRAGGATHGRS